MEGEVKETAKGELPDLGRVLAVVAHPDDESFGLGGVLALIAERSPVSVLCLTRGEVSTLGVGLELTDESGQKVVVSQGEVLGRLRVEEVKAAAAVLGLEGVEVLDYPDGGLPDLASTELCAMIAERARGASTLLVFARSGITGHPDHVRTTEAALTVASELGLPVLAWSLSIEVAEGLNAEFGGGFAGRRESEADFVVRVDRALQRRAIACHVTQSADNPVLWRRLQLEGDRELLHWLRRPGGEAC
ncbi:MAG: PIG-L deacetylase family protein [Acidimicrobiales bacterium]